MDMNPDVQTTVGLEYRGERLEILGILGGSLRVVESLLLRFGTLFPAPMVPLDLGWVTLRVG